MRASVPRILTLLGLAVAGLAHAQTPPDAGEILLQQVPVLRPPRNTPDIRIEPPAPASLPIGGPKVKLQSVSFSGASVFTESELLAALGDVRGNSFDLAGLRGLAERINSLYRARGYPFASVIIPAQTIAGGTLQMDIIEGRYGVVRATGDAALATAAQAYLSGLRPGEVIDMRSLERAIFVLDDLPGVQVAPLIRPGQAVGTGDLDVAIERSVRYRGGLSLDNQGNRYTGRGRVNAALDVDSPFTLGDQISMRLQLTDHSLWFGHLGYSLPIGASGLLAEIVAARTGYTLGKEFASLGAGGTASATSVGLSYPLLRSQKFNLGLAVGWQHRAMNDSQSQAGSRTEKTSRSLPVTLKLDWRDSVGAGAVSYGNLIHTSGRLRMDDLAAAQDAITTGSAGHYSKTSLAFARLQGLTPALSLLAKVSAQWTQHNLDSSEKLSLGGANSVRAAPAGDASGDRGWLTQWELRYTQGAWTPYAFVDAGQVTLNARPWAVGPRKERRAGAGMGARFARGAFFCDATLAWLDSGRPPQSDPQAWVSLGTSF